MSRFISAVVITSGISVGWWFVDYLTHQFDRASIAVPLIAFVAASIALHLYGKEN